MMNYKYTTFTYLFLVIVCCIFTFTFYPRYDKTATESTFGWDGSGYHLYLPALFIDHDIKHLNHFTDSIHPRYQLTPGIDQYISLSNGNKALRYPPGAAFMHSPSFFLTHLLTRYMSYPRDGWSKPYQMGHTISMFLYACIGLWFFAKLCLEFFSDKISATLLIALVIGTNYLDYAFVNVALVHGLSFMWYSILCYATVKWYQQPKIKYSIGIGCAIGILCLLRILDLISVLIPFTIGLIYYKNRLLCSNHKKHIAIVALSATIFISLLICYYYTISGTVLVDTYQGFGFDWKHPHGFDYAWSYRSGWLVYTPMMILSIIGLLVWKHAYRLPLILFLLLYYYFVSAWSIWWYGGRAMIGVYPILFIGLGYLLQQSPKITSLLMLLCCYLNIWYCYHLHYGGIQLIDNTKAHYWATVGRWNHHPETQRLLDGNYLETKNNLIFKTIKTDSSSFSLSPTNPLSEKIAIRITEPSTKIRVALQVQSDTIETDVWKYSQLILARYHNHQFIGSNMLRIQRFMRDSELTDITMDTPVSIGDSLSIYIDHQYSDKEIRIQNWRILSYE